VQLALSRINFEEQSSMKPLHTIVDIASTDAKTKRVLVVVGRSRRMATEFHQIELRQILTENNVSIRSEVPKTLGDVATAFVAGCTDASILVMQAASSTM
jgi:hypothetical protein